MNTQQVTSIKVESLDGEVKIYHKVRPQEMKPVNLDQSGQPQLLDNSLVKN
jgi:hypothetical protein